jgi:serine protease inhibitor
MITEDKMTKLYKKAIIIAAIYFAIGSAQDTTATHKLVTANNDFGFRIFSQLSGNNPQDNIFISAPSISTALDMVYNGASGKTKDAMAKTLGISDLKLDQLNQANKFLGSQLEKTDPKVVLNISNSLWGNTGITFKSDFLDRNKKFYDAEISTLNFEDPSSADVINNWVTDKTNGKINKIIEQLDPSMILMLVNAIYFKGKWTIEFDKKETREIPFYLLDSTEKKVPMMNQSDRFLYFENDSFQAIRLPYGEGKMSMYIFLPKSINGLKNFLPGLNAQTWNEILDKFYFHEGDISLPRFKLEYSVTLNQALGNLGLSNFFGDADFSGISEVPTFISGVLHKTFVEVNEEGTEAAAVTSIMVATATPDEVEPFSMVVDHPFFYAIHDNQTGSILFMGVVVEPK